MSEAETSGARITAIEPLRDDVERCAVRVNGRVRARLRMVDLETLGLAVGARWTEDTEVSVAAARARDATRREALRMLARKGYPSTDLIARLARRGHEEEDARAVVDELVSGGWIDDAAWARDYVREITARKPAGPDLIVRKLRDRGIDADLAEEVAREALAGTDPIEAALGFARARMPGLRRQPPLVAARRIASALARRGIDEETIRIALDRLSLPVAPDGGDAP